MEYRAGDKVTETSNSLIEEKYLNEKDKYSAFLNGNQAITKITTGNKNGKKLLIVKDSYANSFAPFAVNDYEEVHMIDLRAYRQSTMDYMEQNGITDVLLLYNVQNFTEDSNQAAVFFIPICKNVVIAYCVWLTFYQNYVYSI